MPKEVFEDAEGGHRFRIKGHNGEIVGQSESYTREHDAHRGYETLERIVLEDYAARMGKTPEAINFRNAVRDAFLDMIADAKAFELISDEDAQPEYKLVVSDHNLNNLLESLGIVGEFGESAQDTIHRIMHILTPAGVVEPTVEDTPEQDPSGSELPPS